ncbi:MFS transporter [Bacillus cereus]|uniref:MFS transporter n=1 Tax=Bacillus cereus TaxID=1396 RepID=UPI000BFBBA4A|nr:MFS transporter [Bacillus cereus]PGR70379.1 MFS transporter [Bacillus cereus]
MLIEALFVFLLAGTMFSEGMLTVTLTWTILDKGGSAVHLGIVLALMSLLPFFMQKFSTKIREQMTKNPLLIFAGVRCVGILIIIVSLLNAKYLNVLSLYVFAGLFSIILFLSIQSLETYMSQMVLSGRFSSNKASNALQTSIQIGSFGGNALAGFLMSLGGFNYVLYGLALSLGIGVILPLVLPFLKSSNQEKTKESTTVHNDKQWNYNSSKILWVTIIGIAILAVQLSTFNFLVPVLFHNVHHWDPMQYGFVSSAAGIGALLAVLIGKFEKFIPKYIFILIAVFDISIGLIDSWHLSIAAAFGLGFVFNRSRILQRTVLFEFIQTKQETVYWTSRSTLAFEFTKAASPLILALLLQWLDTKYTGIILGVIGFTVSVSMLIIYFYEIKYRTLNQQSKINVYNQM